MAVFTQPDRASGRGQRVSANAIKTWALARGVPVFQPEQLTDAVRAQLAVLGADLSLVMAYGHILREEFIATPRFGTLNLHASILPKYRGASPIQTAVASGEAETGVALMRMVRRLDAGPVGAVERVTIEPLDTALEVEAKLAAACIPLLTRTLMRLVRGQLVFTSQNDAAATYCRRLEKEDGVVDFSAPAETLAARINGLFPWPACHVEIDGAAIKLGLADVAPTPAAPAGGPAAEPGTVLGADADGLLVATGRGTLRLRRLQRPGGRMLAAAEFLRGFAIAPNLRLASQPMPALVARAPFKKAAK